MYIYTGVITNLSTSNTNWRYVVNQTPNAYSNPVAAEKMTALGNHKYRISFTPRSYYPGLAATSEVVQKLAMVFRGATGSPEGKGPGNADILVDVSQTTALQVAFTNPAGGPPLVVAAGTAVAVAGTASAAATLTLTLNGTQVAQQANATTLAANVTISQPGVNTLVLTATSGASTATATATMLVPPTVVTAALPAEAKADGTTYLNNGTSVILSLTAPKKSYVYALGDFNN